MLYTETGAFTCYEFTRVCSECDATHHSDHATRYDESGTAVHSVAYNYDDIQILRSTSLSLFEKKMVDSASFMHIQGNVSIYTSAHLVSSSLRRLQDRPIDVCANDLLNHALLQLWVLFWHQKVGTALGLSSSDVNLCQVWMSEVSLNEYLKYETRDNGIHDRGLFITIFNVRALQHECASYDFCRWSISQVHVFSRSHIHYVHNEQIVFMS